MVKTKRKEKIPRNFSIHYVCLSMYEENMLRMLKKNEYIYTGKTNECKHSRVGNVRQTTCINND